jgi:hypothetical protein
MKEDRTHYGSKEQPRGDSLMSAAEDKFWTEKLNIRFVTLILILCYQFIIKKRYSYESNRNSHSHAVGQKEGA